MDRPRSNNKFIPPTPFWNSSPRTEHELAVSWRIRRVLELMRNRTHAEVLDLHYFQNKSYKEIAKLRGTTKRAVIALMKRAEESFVKTLVGNKEELRVVPEEVTNE